MSEKKTPMERFESPGVEKKTRALHTTGKAPRPDINNANKRDAALSLSLVRAILLASWHLYVMLSTCKWTVCKSYRTLCQFVRVESVWRGAVFPLRKFCTEQKFPLSDEYAIAQPCECTTGEALHGPRGIYTILNSECCKCARMRFHCTNGLVVTAQLRSLEGTLSISPVARLNIVH